MELFPHSFQPNAENNDRDTFLCRFADHLERPEDVANYLLKLIPEKKYLTAEQRDLFSSSFEQILEKYRSSFRTINFVKIEKGNDEASYIVSPYLRENMNTITSKITPYISSQIKFITNKVLEVLPILLTKSSEVQSPPWSFFSNSDSPSKSQIQPQTEEYRDAIEASVFYYKTQGDYYRYQTEAESLQEELNEKCKEEGKEEVQVDTEKKKELIVKASESYENGFNIGQKELGLTNHGVLGIALNFSVYMYEIQNNKKEAIEFMQDVYNKSMKLLPSVKDQREYDKLHVILLLAKDNLESWKIEIQGEDQGEKE